MDSSTEMMIIECTKELADDLRSEIEDMPEQRYQVVERKNLDGDVATWIVLATLFSQSLPSILTFISSRRHRLPTKITVKNSSGSEVTIENPTQEDLERLRLEYMAKDEGKKKRG